MTSDIRPILKRLEIEDTGRYDNHFYVISLANSDEYAKMYTKLDKNAINTEYPEFASNTNNDSFQEGFENNNNTSDLKTLEERICKIETELKKKKTKPAISHIRRNNSGTKN